MESLLIQYGILINVSASRTRHIRKSKIRVEKGKTIDSRQYESKVDIYDKIKDKSEYHNHNARGQSTYMLNNRLTGPRLYIIKARYLVTVIHTTFFLTAH